MANENCSEPPLSMMYLKYRDNPPLAGPKFATRDYSRLSCGLGDTQFGPGARMRT
jgi:hypothetical protein